jgi:hypothetical protein
VPPPIYLLEGFQCGWNAANDALTETELIATRRRQGSVIRVCVKPDAEAVTAGIRMRSLDDFTFSRGLVNQPAITGYNQEANNGLTSLSCRNGVDVCVFGTILFAAFYTSQCTGVVFGSGTGSMQFGTRRLRALQPNRPEAVATSEFALDFGVEHTPTVYLLLAYECDLDNNPLGANMNAAALASLRTRQQESTVRVCVRPDATAVTAGMKMHNLDWLTFSRDAIRQEAIIGYNLEASNGMTKLTCSNGADVRVIETIFSALFFYDSTPGIVFESGGGSMQFGDTPEAVALSGFEVAVTVAKQPQTDSPSAAPTTPAPSAVAADFPAFNNQAPSAAPSEVDCGCSGGALRSAGVIALVTALFLTTGTFAMTF